MAWSKEKRREYRREYYAKHKDELNARRRAQYVSKKKPRPPKEKKPKVFQQPCWTCQNACGGCSWSDSFEPVGGWKAEEKSIMHMNGTAAHLTMSYKILACPEYRSDS